MKELPGLNLIERLALWILLRSPRTSLVVVKEHLWPGVFLAADPTDLAAAFVAQGLQEEPENLEPPSMLLERLFHAPAYGEQE